jgi:hypothetical protein
MTSHTRTVSQMKLSHIKGILSTIPSFVSEDYQGIKVGSRSSLFSDLERIMCMHIHSDLHPIFWIAVATWYCDQERLYLPDVPEWTPLDLATDCILDDSHNMSFPHFVLLTEE